MVATLAGGRATEDDDSADLLWAGAEEGTEADEERRLPLDLTELVDCARLPGFGRASAARLLVRCVGVELEERRDFLICLHHKRE